MKSAKNNSIHVKGAKTTTTNKQKRKKTKKTTTTTTTTTTTKRINKDYADSTRNSNN